MGTGRWPFRLPFKSIRDPNGSPHITKGQEPSMKCYLTVKWASGMPHSPQTQKASVRHPTIRFQTNHCANYSTSPHINRTSSTVCVKRHKINPPSIPVSPNSLDTFSHGNLRFPSNHKHQVSLSLPIQLPVPLGRLLTESATDCGTVSGVAKFTVFPPC